MKINFVVANLKKVGGIRVILEYAFRLQRMGHEVNIFYRLFAYDFRKGKGIFYFIKRMYWSVAVLLKTESERSRFNIRFKNVKLLPKINNLWVPDADAIIASEWPVAFDIYKLKRSKGDKYYLLQGNETHFSDNEFVEKALRLPMKKIVVSGYLQQLLKKKYGIDSLIVNNAVDFNFFNNPNKEFDHFQKQIIFIDSPAEVKRISDIIEAIEMLHKMNPKIKIVAFGSKRSKLIPPYVKYFEDPDDEKIKDIYCSSDIFIGASREEGFYLAPAEAMACKCAVIVTKVGAVEDFSEHMKSAVHISPFRPVEIFNSVQMLLDKPELLKKISIAGYEVVRSKLNWENSVTQFVSILEQ